MMIWSPSSWSLWKQCPAKYRIGHIERYEHLDEERDTAYAKLAVPGLVVDKLLELWLHRGEFQDINWPKAQFRMAWSMMESEKQVGWNSDEERLAVVTETKMGLATALTMLSTLELEKYQLFPQASFFQKITKEFAITGRADLLMVDPKNSEGTLIDFKNAHSRQRMTKDQLVIYQMGLEQAKGIKIKRGGYLLFNPRLEAWKWFTLHDGFKQRYLMRLLEATEDVQRGDFPYNWNQFTCVRFCDVRYSCELFRKLIKQ